MSIDAGSQAFCRLVIQLLNAANGATTVHLGCKNNKKVDLLR